MNCPICGCCNLASLTNGMIVCPQCGFEIDEETWDNIVEENRKKYNLPDPNNPYTEFAKEMSLLHEALKAEGFKDAMVDILAKMAPILWDRCVHLEYVKENEAKNFLNKKFGVPEWVKESNELNQKLENAAWAKARKEAGL